MHFNKTMDTVMETDKEVDLLKSGWTISKRSVLLCMGVTTTQLADSRCYWKHVVHKMGCQRALILLSPRR